MCGIFGIYLYGGRKDAIRVALSTVETLGNRGRDSGGIVFVDEKGRVRVDKWNGRPHEVFSSYNREFVELITHEGEIKECKIAGIHIRWGTKGDKDKPNAQPQWSETKRGKLVVLGNGDIINYEERRRFLEEKGFKFLTQNDSELFAHEIAYWLSNGNEVEDAIRQTVLNIQGAYTNIIVYDGEMYVIRDPQEIRPACLGEIDCGFVVASETCVLEKIGARMLGKIKGGELIFFKDYTLQRIQLVPKAEPNPCIFEFVYFSRGDSFDLESMRQFNYYRYINGIKLASEHPVDNADFVIPIMQSGFAAACGFANELKISILPALLTDSSIGRSFTGRKGIREITAVDKHRPIVHLLALNFIADRREEINVVIVDDSIVRLTTIPKIVSGMKEAVKKLFPGLKLKVHARIASPPVKGSCFFGQDTPTQKELGFRLYGGKEGVLKAADLESLEYLSLEGLLKPLAPRTAKDFCTGCFNPESGYPMDVSHLIRWE